ncbi:hypothetical protein [Streptomyces nigra]|uniref:hypothetical protein n=1 Tax=Streptomyces nigra TaxID=1827580 RepID=UPI003828AE44
MPLLFVEIDDCFESAQVLAAKIDKYMQFCQRTRPMTQMTQLNSDTDGYAHLGKQGVDDTVRRR